MPIVNVQAAHIFVGGRVQGVGYRNFAQRQAMSLQLTGYARNLPDGRVEVQVEGDRVAIEKLISHLWQGPIRADVTGLDVSWQMPSLQHNEFLILF